MGGRKFLIVIGVLLAAGCATPEVDHSRSGFDPYAYERHLAECRGHPFHKAIWTSVKYVTEGAVAGAAVGAAAGGVSGNEWAVVGAAVGGLIGLGVGACEGYEQRRGEIAECLKKKGYSPL